jgi:hypothetical protein
MQMLYQDISSMRMILCLPRQEEALIRDAPIKHRPEALRLGVLPQDMAVVTLAAHQRSSNADVA